MSSDRDRDASGRARQARPRDKLGRPLPYGSAGVEPVSEDPLPPSETARLANRICEAVDAVGQNVEHRFSHAIQREYP